MRKIICAFLMSLCVCPVFFAVDMRVVMPNTSSKEIFPEDSDLGECVFSKEVSSYPFLLSALREPYSLEWAEKYLHGDYKKNITKVYSSVFSEILPCRNVLFSRVQKYADGTEVITAKFPDSKKIISFAIKDEKIYAVLM